MAKHPDDVRSTRYEWVIETCTADEHEDIEDLHHVDRLMHLEDQHLFDAIDKKRFHDERFDPPNGMTMFNRIALCRDVGCQAEGIEDRQYAYVNEDGELPETFDEGAKIPKRFREELAKIMQRKKEA